MAKIKKYKNPNNLETRKYFIYNKWQIFGKTQNGNKQYLTTVWAKGDIEPTLAKFKKSKFYKFCDYLVIPKRDKVWEEPMPVCYA